MRITTKQLLKKYDKRQQEAILLYWQYVREAIEDENEFRDIFVHRLGKFYMIGHSINLLHIRYSKSFRRGDIDYEYYKYLTTKMMDICAEKGSRWKRFSHLLLEIKMRFLINKHYVLGGEKEQCYWSVPLDYVEEVNI